MAARTDKKPGWLAATDNRNEPVWFAGFGVRVGHSGGHPTCVAMMQGAHLGDLGDLAHLRRLDCAGIRAVIVERLVRSRRIIVACVALQNAPKMLLIQDDKVRVGMRS